ncbi:MAG: LrgB family protein [Lachnospiraceae bacterium]|nr:LrgB family protein [Lachnospiraceae bacterium]
MSEFLSTSSAWGTVLTIGFFGLFFLVQQKVKKAWANPLLFSAVCIGAFLILGKIPYQEYKASSSVISWLLLPATVSLAIPLYEQWELLKKNLLAILCGIVSGVVTSLLCAVAIAKIFSLETQYAVSIMPKSVTTAIGTDVAAELGGVPSLAIVIIVLTGVIGNLLAPFLCKLFRLKSPIARGIAIGSSSHAIGTTKALEMGPVEGAMSSLSIAVAGVLTAVLCPVFANLL